MPRAALLLLWPWAAWLTLAAPTLWDFLGGTWSAYSQGHEPLFMLAAFALIWRSARSADGPPSQATLPAWWAWTWGLALLLYLFGRSQEFIRTELFAVWWLMVLCVRATLGPGSLKRHAFALGFALLAMPLPFGLVLTLTAPLKLGVSVVVCEALQALGLPVGRTGVIITAGQYQLLVAEACAGLQTMFVLEAVGLLYSHLVAAGDRRRQIALALSAVPIAFASNVVRVMLIVLITLYFGDGAGQSFIHNFAGLVLFAFALGMLSLLDMALTRLWPPKPVVQPTGAPVPKLTHDRTHPSSTRTRVVAGVCALGIAWLTWWAHPEAQPDSLARVNTSLASLFPTQIGAWHLQPDSQEIVRPAFERARQFQMYDQVLERIYQGPQGQRLMLSVAYGRKQSVGLQMHAPQVCYRAGGFEVSGLQTTHLALPTHVLPLTQFVGSLPGRPEPVTYWRLLGDTPVDGDSRFRLRQLAQGLLHRRVDDGMLVRVSTIEASPSRAWRTQQAFILDLYGAMSAHQRMRVFGQSTPD